MAEFIEREALLRKKHGCNRPNCSGCDFAEDGDSWCSGELFVVNVLSIPAADVRPVVMCRDCVHFQQFRPHDGFCKIDGMLWNNDFFCANGKREES